MRSPVAALLVFAASALAQITLDPHKCFTLSTNGTQYLDSTNSVLAIQVHPDRASLEAGGDKGVRFHFPTGDRGWVVCEAHDGHFVGTTIPPSNWKTDISQGSTSEIATIGLVDGGAGPNPKAWVNATPRHFIGVKADVVSAPFYWDIRPINCLVNK
ncbi:hypothetical protein MIND_01355900 [Mycena indigotica]|uniref:Uncharacterized protein n=1 Tax=Mycena indigotica TaxID=2126181 RepID=A0A8H6VRY6_9AGAR|nr:uncharacterized protein MIND_01355900 [Mycena indigotica]KAF7289816.1 hypothetical protein MIND_01355900 [Mycena indigotica]